MGLSLNISWSHTSLIADIECKAITNILLVQTQLLNIFSWLWLRLSVSERYRNQFELCHALSRELCHVWRRMRLAGVTLVFPHNLQRCLSSGVMLRVMRRDASDDNTMFGSLTPFSVWFCLRVWHLLKITLWPVYDSDPAWVRSHTWCKRSERVALYGD